MTHTLLLRRSLAVLATVFLSIGLLGVQSGSAALVAPAARSTVKVAKLAVVTLADGRARVEALVKGKGVKSVVVVGDGVTYKLRKQNGQAWRSRMVADDKAAELKELVGEKLTVRVKANGRTTVRKVPAKAASDGGTAPVTPPDPVTPGPDPVTPPPDAGGGSPNPEFPAPGTDRTGPEAWDAIRPYFENSRFTNCPTGWGSGVCASEERYSHMSNGQQYYCRITSVSGPDINSVGTIVAVLGAEQKADGSWAVTYALDSYGNITHYTWRVAADGSVTGEYWGPGIDPTTAVGQPITDLVWARGGLSCDQYTP